MSLDKYTYTNPNTNIYTNSKPKPGFRGDIVYDNTHTHTINDILAQDETIAPNYSVPDTKIKNHTIIINSIDRNWYSYPNETPYNFLVKLGGSPKDQYSIVSHDYKNVVSFSIEKIILPNRPCIQSYNSTITPRLNDNAYLALTVKGINYSSYGTNKTLNNTIGIYTPLIPLPITLSEISYLEFKNTSVQKKEYNPTPEGYISALDLSITTPSGLLVSNNNDVLDIYSIFLNSNTSNIYTNINISDSLIIQTNTYFNPIEFRVNDLITIKNYKYHNDSFDECNIFNSWINRDAGHYILCIGKSNPGTTLYNQIIIPIPAALSRSTGNIVVESWFSSFDMKSLSNVAIQDNGGKLINVNTQSHLVVNIKTMEKNDNIFLKDL